MRREELVRGENAVGETHAEQVHAAKSGKTREKRMVNKVLSHLCRQVSDVMVERDL